MGSRGAFDKSDRIGIAKEHREYSVVGHIGGYEVIKWDAGSNNKTPPFSNTPDTVYFLSSTKNGKIRSIYYYRDHRLVRSVDIEGGGKTAHAHKWVSAGHVVGRISHDSTNVFPLNKQDKILFNKAKQWNDEHE